MVQKSDGDVFTDTDHTQGTQVIEQVDSLPDASTRPNQQLVVYQNEIYQNQSGSWVQITGA